MPAQMFVFPVLPNIALPDEFTKYAQAGYPARFALSR